MPTENILEALSHLVYQVASSWWLPGVMAGLVFLAACWSIRKSMRAVLAGR